MAFVDSFPLVRYSCPLLACTPVSEGVFLIYPWREMYLFLCHLVLPLQGSCLENLMGRGAWQVTVHGAAKEWTWLTAKQQTTKFKAYSVMIWLTCIINKGGLNMGIYWGFTAPDNISPEARVSFTHPMDGLSPRSGHYGGCHGPNICIPLKFISWNSNDQGDAIRRLGSGRWSGHEDGVLMIGINVLLKETSGSPLNPSTIWGHGGKVSSMNQEVNPTRHDLPASCSSWTFQFPELWEIHFCCL